MSVPSYFSPVAKILIQSGYVNPKQMQQVIAKFQRSGRAIAQGGLSLIEVLESITQQSVPEHLRHHLLSNFSDSSSSFVERLIQSDYVDDDQMQQALAETHNSGKLLTEILEEITGHQFPSDLLHQSKKQLRFELEILYGLESLDPEKIDSTDVNQIAELINILIPIDICSRYGLLPLERTQTQPPSILIAMVNPENLDALDDLHRILQPQRIVLQRVVITQEDYQQLISRYRAIQLERNRQVEFQIAVEIKQNLENLDSFATSLDIVSQLIDTLIPIDVCSRYHLVPVGKNETQPSVVLVAMVDLDNLDAEDELNRILRPQGITLQKIVITLENYQQLISKYHDKKLKQTQKEEFCRIFYVQENLKDLEHLDTGFDVRDKVQTIVLKGSEDVSIINLVNRILAKALQQGASDIHVEPQEDALRIRFRQDGVLHQACDPLPKKITLAVAARLKIMANLNIAEQRLPQDGKIRRLFQGRIVNFRVSTLPSRYGETIVLRILDNKLTQLSLDRLIKNPDTLASIRAMASRAFGLIVVAGPTDSGKLTTLYSILAERNNPGVKICTAEDPIEYFLPGITQVQVLREKGMDFASIIRSFLRQDPDVILISEMRDKETAKTGIEAVLANHLVLTRLYANDAASAIAHLKRIGVEPFMIAEALIGVITQRLIRRVCFDCRIPYHPSASELAKFGWSTSGEGVLTLYKANTLQPEEMQEAKAKGTLCQTCNGVGYKGRIGVYEMMHISERLQTLITEAASTEQIREAAIEEGITTLLTDSLAMVRNGYTTLAEVERLTFTDSHLEAELKAKQYNPLSHYSSQKISGKDPSIDPLYQLQELEKHLEELTHQFQQLKQQLKT